MAIVKVKPNFLKHSGFSQSYTVILNSTIDLIPDDSTLGIYLYLARKPDDWEIWEQDIMQRFNRGRDHVRKCLKILKEVGLLKKTANRDEKGQVTSWTTTLYDQVTEKPSSGETHITEKPSSGERLETHAQSGLYPDYWKPHLLDNPTHTKERYLQIKEVKKKKEEMPLLSSTLISIKTTNPLAEFLPDKYLLLQYELTAQCLSDQKSKDLFDQRFKKLEVSFEEMLYECVMYYALKPESQNVSPHRFRAWIKREKTELYDKKPDSFAHKLFRDLSDEEKKLIADYNHFMKYPELKDIMSDIQKQKAQDLIKLLKSTQNMREL